MKIELKDIKKIKQDTEKNDVDSNQLYLLINSQLKDDWFRNASTKTRSMVRGGGAKPYAQKGTGRARRGTQRSPLIVGGGVTFGPYPHVKSNKINNKQSKSTYQKLLKKLLYSTHSKQLSVTAKEDEQNLLKTKDFKILSNNEKKIVFLTVDDIHVKRCIKNINNLRILKINSFCVQELVGFNSFVFSENAVNHVKDGAKNEKNT